jgi:hypothetical protein
MVSVTFLWDRVTWRDGYSAARFSHAASHFIQLIFLQLIILF